MQVSIVIPYFNASATIALCVEAIKKQVESGDELIIVDDGSSLLEAQKLKLLEGCKVVEHQENKGAATARNTGMETAQSDVIIFVDADVCLEDDCLSTIKETLKSGADACFIVPGSRRQESFFSDYKNLYMRAILTKENDDLNYVYGSCCAVNKSYRTFSWPSDLSLIEDNVWGHKLWKSGAIIKRITSKSFIHRKKYNAYGLMKNDFMVARQFSRFMVRAKRWNTLYGREKFGHTSKEQKASVIAAALILPAVILGIMPSLLLLLFWVGLNISLFKYLWKQRGLKFFMASILWTYISHLVYFLGIVFGFFEELLTTLNGHRTGVEQD